MNIFKWISKSDKRSTIGRLKLRKLINQAITAFESVNEYKTEVEFLNHLSSLTSDYSLAWELYTLIPEAFTRLIVTDPKYSDEIIINKHTGGSVKLSLKSMEVYKEIINVVQTRIEKGNNDKIELILFSSAAFNAIQNAILNGSKMENLSLMPLSMNAPANYMPTIVE